MKYLQVVNEIPVQIKNDNYLHHFDKIAFIALLFSNLSSEIYVYDHYIYVNNHFFLRFALLHSWMMERGYPNARHLIIYV